MGLFNLKKSKNDAGEDFEASDEWLMGLAGDDVDRLGSGPNASIPTELQSLAPPIGFDADPVVENGHTEELLAAGWHLPDFAAAERDDDEALAPPPPPPGMLFDERPSGAQATDPFPFDDTIAEPALGGTEDPSGFESHFFSDESSAHQSDSIANPVDQALDRFDPPLIENAVIEDPAVEDARFDLVGRSASPPRGSAASMCCEILGVDSDASWAELHSAHAGAMAQHDPDLETDEDRVALARAIRREINSAYATLRLLAAS